MRASIRVAATAGIVILAVTGSLALGGSALASSRVVGHLYVNDNTAGTNTIAAFDRHADGSLVPMSGSPFSIGGAGTGSSTGSQGALQMTADGRYLLAVDAGSNQISVLGIKPGGGLTPPIGGPVSSSASLSTATSSTSRTRATGAATTRDSCSRAVVSGPCRARRCRCPTDLPPARCCSTAMEPTSQGCGWARH